MSDKYAKLEDAYALKTPDDSRKLYAAWAETYDQDFIVKTGYVQHQSVVRAFVEANGKGPVLDVGSGTGICGVALRDAGVDIVDATDISPEMLDQAQAKGVYRKCIEGDILAGLPIPDESYEGVVSAGTFTLGHVGPAGLDEVIRVLSPGGLAVITVRDTHFEAENFAEKIDSLHPMLSDTKTAKCRVYSDEDASAHADDESMLVYLWKKK